MERKLTSLNIGQTATIKQLNNANPMRRRLRDLGMINGTNVECVLKSPGNDPIAYSIRGAVIALRNKDTDNIIVY